MHLLDITSGERHPDAVQPVIRTVSNRGRLFLVQVHHQYVAWLTWVSRSPKLDLEVWDWRTTRLVWVSTVDSLRLCELRVLTTELYPLQRRTFRPQVSFAFLDASHILVTSGRQEVMEVFRFDDPAYAVGDTAEPFLTLEPLIGTSTKFAILISRCVCPACLGLP